MRLLQISAHFSPNVGGVETHLDDLVRVLVNKNFDVFVLTYSPLTIKTRWKIFENGKKLTVFRIPWIAGLFYKFVRWPILEFLYLLPGLLLFTPFAILTFNPKVIHAHGLVAGFVGVFWGRLFGKKVIISTHSIYNFPKSGLYRSFVNWIFENADWCLGLSKQATSEIESLGISRTKVKKFTYWIDLEKFKKILDAKNEQVPSSGSKLSWRDRFVVLFVGRLVLEKGVELLLESVKSWDKDISLKIIGSGPLENKVKEVASKLPNVDFIQGIDHDNLPIYYSGSDILIVPSIHEEGFGRVILESLACGTPVIGANRGAIGEAIDETVGKLIEISPENIKKQVEYFYNHPEELKQLAKNCRKFAERRFSEKNADTVIRLYQE